MFRPAEHGIVLQVKEAEYMCHVFVRGDSLAAVAVSDHEYPPRVAHTMLTRSVFVCLSLPFLCVFVEGNSLFCFFNDFKSP